MSNKPVQTTGDKIISMLKDMISPDEIVEKISRRTTVKTNKGEHTIWESTKKNGDTAIFTRSKKKK